MTLRLVPAADRSGDWADLRHALWPDESRAEHLAEIEEGSAADGSGALNLVALDGDRPAGFVEATIRHDYVNGCDTSPVAFVEGLYVAPDARDAGVARRLVDAVADWGRSRGCSELASDADLANQDSHAFHAAIGFEEIERVVCFRRLL